MDKIYNILGWVVLVVFTLIAIRMFIYEFRKKPSHRDSVGAARLNNDLIGRRLKK